MLFATAWLILSGLPGLRAQNTSVPLWPRLEAQLNQPFSDSSLQVILLLVRDHCGEDYDCLYQTYHALMSKLGEGYHLPGAIYLCEEMVKTAHRHKNLRDEASANMILNSYYGALGYSRLAVVNIDKALVLFEQMGDSQAITYAQMCKLEQSLSHRPTEDVLPEMNALLDRSIGTGDAKSTLYIHTRLVGLTIEARRYDEAERHILALEKMPVSDPVKIAEYPTIITAALGRADLAMTNNDWDAAETNYQKTLHFALAEPNRWMETHALNSLAHLEWRRGNPALAKTYLDKAQTVAEKLELNDLLIRTFNLKVLIAEKEGNYIGALEFYKKEHYYDQKFKDKSAGFDIENYYLQLEKNQLATEKKTQELELSLKKAQLRNSLITMALALLLASLLVFAFIKLRKRKDVLVAQNALILDQSKQLKALDAAKSRFFANVSHELRTPLALMLGPIGTLLKDNQLTAKQSKLLQLAQHSSKQLEQLVTDILDLGKLEMGKMELDEKPTELAPFFRSYFAQFESLAESRQIDFSFDIAVDNDVVVHVDQAKYRQILNNLLTNAFKFTPAGGRVEAKLSLNDGVLQLSVADTGPGIHPDDLPHLFDRYFQTTRPDKPAEGGTGIGLTLCHEYAELFGGKIEVESTLGHGTTFRVWLPVKLADNAHISDVAPKILDLGLKSEPAPIATPAVTSDTAKPTILVVEDNSDLQAYIRLILSEKYQVVTAENGQAALSMMNDELGMMNVKPDAANSSFIIHHSSLPDLVLSDLMMPVMDGLQLLEKLKSSDATRHIPVIMLTARAEARDKLKALRIGVDDYLTKPFDEEELLARIENLLKNQKARQAEASSETEPEATAPLLSQPDRAWLETFEVYVQQHFASEILTVSALARAFAMSESTLLRQLKRLTGLSPVQYLQEVRLSEAWHLLESRAYDSIAEVASKVGYEDARSFSRSFRARFGKLPSELLGE